MVENYGEGIAAGTLTQSGSLAVHQKGTICCQSPAICCLPGIKMKKILYIILLLFARTQDVPAQTSQYSKASRPITRDYKLLEATINRQKFPFPVTMSYRIRAELKEVYRLAIFESRPRFRQEYTMSLPALVTFRLQPDTTGHHPDAVHFVLKMKDSVFVVASLNNRREQYGKQLRVIFTLESPYLIAEAESLLNNICRDNERRRKLYEAKKLEETY